MKVFFRGAVLTLVMVCAGVSSVVAQQVTMSVEQYEELLAAKRQVDHNDAWKNRSPYEITAGVEMLPIVVWEDYWPNTYKAVTLSLPVFNFGFTYKLNKLITIGVLTNYTQRRFDYFDFVYGFPEEDVRTYDEGKQFVYTQSDYMFSVAPRLRLDWFRRKYVMLYSGVAVGATFVISKNLTKNSRTTDVDPYFDVTWLGARFGGKLFAYIDLSISNVGFNRIGMGYNF